MNVFKNNTTFCVTFAVGLQLCMFSQGALQAMRMESVQACINSITKTKTATSLFFLGAGLAAYTLYRSTRPAAIAPPSSKTITITTLTVAVTKTVESKDPRDTVYHHQRPCCIDYSSTAQRKLFKHHVHALQKITDGALLFFEHLIAHGLDPKDAGVIIFDIDGTLLTGAFHPKSNMQEVIEPVYYLYHYLIDKGFIIDLVTNRPCINEAARNATVKDLSNLGYTGYRNLYMRPAINVEDKVIVSWKAGIRKKIAKARAQDMKNSDKQPILASFGDSDIDFLAHHDGNSYAGKKFKFPDIPRDQLDNVKQARLAKLCTCT